MVHQVTDAPPGGHPIKQAPEPGPATPPQPLPLPAQDSSLTRRQTPGRAHRGSHSNFRFCDIALDRGNLDRVAVMTERQLDKLSAWLLSAILVVIMLGGAIYVFYLVVR